MAYVRANGHPGSTFVPGFGSWLSSAVSSIGNVVKPVVATSAAFLTGGLSVVAAQRGLISTSTFGVKPTVTGLAAGAAIGGAILASGAAASATPAAATTSPGDLEAIDAAQAAASQTSPGGLEEIDRMVASTTGSKATTVATPTPAALQASIFGTGETNTILIAGGIGLLALLLYGRK